ncbi:hypothetical protein [Streptomyces maremycinicus]|uniref:hypothetical protein n=1 Tax=Streptomyces maremycinicus TaxID=1679753 RepID=UPI00078847A3|nr:hypothetical protein [Streptomyces sp. NBRC 110468]
MTEFDRPLHSLVAYAYEAATVYQAAHDLNVQQVGPPWRVNTLRLKNRMSVSPAAKGRQQPSKLLRTRDEVVDFSGRADEEEEFTVWRDSDEAVLIRLLHAPGGEGKTRFARHLGRTWGRKGWVALDAQHTKTPGQDTGGMPRVTEGAKGVLIIVDYAERWPEDDLVGFVRESRRLWKLPLRILLLSRPAGVWWEQVEYLLDKELELDAEAIRLAPLGTRAEERERAFFAARDAFAERLKVSDPEAIGPPERLLSDDAYSMILTIHMAALAAVDASHRGTSAPVDPARLSSYLLRRERDHWRNLERGKRIQTDASTLECAVYAASLCGPMRQREADGVAVVMGIASNRERARGVIQDHAFCYPPPPALRKTDSVLEALQPDRLAEDFVALSLPGHDGEFTPQPWAAEATNKLLNSTWKEIDRSVRGALTTLIEMATRWRHISVDYLSPLLTSRPRIVLECGNASLATLADNPHIGIETLRAVAAVLRGREIPGLGTGAAAILSQVIKAQQQEVDDPAEKAALCHELTAVYQFAGLFDQAAGAARDEVALLRPLAEAEPEDYRSALADALFSLCAALTEQGNHEEAAAFGTEALNVRRGSLPLHGGISPDSDPDDRNRTGPRPVAGPFGTALASSLVHHAEWLFYEKGDPRALAICGEAVSLLRRVTERSPNRRACLARALQTQTGIHLRTADLGAALRTAAQSVSASRDLFAERNSVHRAERLVRALALMSTVQVKAGQTRAAIGSANEAVSLARRVVASDEKRTALLAHALSILGECMAYQAPTQAVAVSSEALRMNRSLARKDPRHRAALAVSLAKHATVLLKCGKADSARPLTLESVSLTEADANADATAPVDASVLALTLGALADALKISGDHGEALTAARKAAKATEELAQRLPWYASDLAEHQGRVADILLSKGELRGSEEMARLALRTYAHFRQTYGPLPWLDVRLTISCARSLVLSGNLKASARSIRRIEATLREVGATDGEDTAPFLTLVALHQWAANHREEAAASARDAVILFRARIIERPGVKLELVTALELHGTMAVEQGRMEVGLLDLQEANTLLKELRRDSPGNSFLVPFQVRCLTSLGLAYHLLERDEEARSATKEAVSLVPEGYLPAMALETAVDAHITFARIRLESGERLPDAVQVARTAFKLCAAAGSAGLLDQAAELRYLLSELTGSATGA